MTGHGSSSGPKGFLSRSLAGYAALGRALGGMALFLGSVAAGSAAVVIPLWLLATRSPALYSILALLAFGGGGLGLLVLRLRRASRAAGGPGAWVRCRLLPSLGRLGFVALSILTVYVAALLWTAGLAGAAVPLLVVYLALLGVAAHGVLRRRRHADDVGDERSS